ncbi:uncharacterized protein LOC119100931 [Pollicipes pollicipes]|uniref:uncharacterized protein LOC119100931 n=1 Tax=Pollicipes pollicipes TaxID=41117 RepID=UPI001884AB96|nr:uncharacterized protein LOC119100931 [Pollicipes pollicipes]XP_037080035.1 uncharacterized protein LOC119100931 [Pollicipes pollicipes]
MWRLLPLDDPLVDVFVSRDLDSLPSQREAAAVAAWLHAPETFHIMRDHWDHLITMPGGLWGAKVGQKRPLMARLKAELNGWVDHARHKNWDQRALHGIVWNHASVDSVQHDSYTCQRFPGYTVPFPTQRTENDTTLYVGQVVTDGSGGSGEKLRTCPVACRPQEHRDWDYC